MAQTFTPPVTGSVATAELPKPKVYKSGPPQWKKDSDAWFDNFAKGIPADPKQSVFLDVPEGTSYRKVMGLIRGGLDRTETKAKMRADHEANKVYVTRVVATANGATPAQAPVAAGAR